MSFTIRKACTDDIPSIAHIHVAGWQAAYGGIVDQGYLDSLSTEKREQDWQKWFADGNMNVLVSEDAEGNVSGFTSFGKLRTPLPGMSPIRPLYSAEIYAIYTLPDSWGTGVGKALMEGSVKELAIMKHKSLCLWVLEKNKRAVSFYKKLGGERCGKKDIEIGPTTAREIAFGWRDSKVLLSGQN